MSSFILFAVLQLCGGAILVFIAGYLIGSSKVDYDVNTSDIDWAITDDEQKNLLESPIIVDASSYDDIRQIEYSTTADVNEFEFVFS